MTTTISLDYNPMKLIMMADAYPPSLLCDFYKIAHRVQYPASTNVVYSTWTPRASRNENITGVITFGIQAFIKKYLINYFNKYFFDIPKETAIAHYHYIIKHALKDPNPHTAHLEKLHDLGYLPLKIMAIPEGIKLPIRVPMLTIENTDPDFFWLTNYIETLVSCELWHPITSATIANEYRQLLNGWAMATVGETSFVPFQGHDFSMRGLEGIEAAAASGAGHLLSFIGTDTILSILYHMAYYKADISTYDVGTSIPATEHSVQCAYGNDDLYIRRIITEVYPSGFVSVVSDGYDFWDVIGRVIPSLKREIMARDGRVVIRPDSGDPIKIVCGDPDGKTELERKGAVEALWDIFGGVISEKGYKVLDSHIGLIYGDSITFDRCQKICEGLAAKGFASINVVFGIGSFTYQYNTRDTFGFALKSTFCNIDGKDIEIFKDPKTDSGIKKSLKGKVAVINEGGKLVAKDQLKTSHPGDILETVFLNGKLLNEVDLPTIRSRMQQQ